MKDPPHLCLWLNHNISLPLLWVRSKEIKRFIHREATDVIAVYIKIHEVHLRMSGSLIFNLPKFSWPPSSKTSTPFCPIQDGDAGLQGRHQSRTSPICLQILIRTGPCTSTSFYYISWPANTAIAESKQSPLSKVLTLVLAPQLWNELLTNVRTAESLAI